MYSLINLETEKHKSKFCLVGSPEGYINNAMPDLWWIVGYGYMNGVLLFRYETNGCTLLRNYS